MLYKSRTERCGFFLRDDFTCLNYYSGMKLLSLLVFCTLSLNTFADGLPYTTSGAAAGYVADNVCRDCHVSHYDSYQHVGMAQSFKKPVNARSIETFGVEFFHAPSKRYYKMLRQGDELVFKRYQKDDSGNVLNDIEIPVDWVLGSGNRTRSYLYQTDHGELFQLPIGWYSEGGFWEMSPGFESPGHEGLSREITRQCMFCHNAFPEVETDKHAAPDIFPHELPEGTGCQRCHGPGGNHVKAALTGADLSSIREKIVNPAKLDPPERDSVCMQCHLLPAISVVGPVKFDRGDFSFRPGELLTDFMTQLDIRESGVSEPERFEINHHGYRLMKSACYQQGGLTCIDCHNPHIKPSSSEFRTKVGGVCMDCHGPVTHQPTTAVIEGDCVSCHMPARRTIDVVHVTMTDHWIARGPFDLEALVAPLEPEYRQVTDIKPLDFGATPDEIDAKTYIAVAAIRAKRSVDAASNSLVEALSEREYNDYAPYLELARAWLQTGDFERAEAAARGLVRGDRNLAVAHNVLGIAQMALGKSDQAKLSFKRSLALENEPEVHFALASLYFENNQLTLADAELDKAVALRPFLSRAFAMKGQIASLRGRLEQANTYYSRALAINPGRLDVYGLLIDSLQQTGQNARAEQYRQLYQQLTGNESSDG